MKTLTFILVALYVCGSPFIYALMDKWDASYRPAQGQKMERVGILMGFGTIVFAWSWIIAMLFVVLKIVMLVFEHHL